MYDYELLLIKTEYQSDAIGNQKPVETLRPVLCKVNSIGRREFYAAAVTDFKPEIIFTMNKYDYDNERYVEFENERYKVLRQYPVPGSYEEIELTCERVGNDGEHSN